jgi:hypothetical protein
MGLKKVFLRLAESADRARILLACFIMSFYKTERHFSIEKSVMDKRGKWDPASKKERDRKGGIMTQFDLKIDIRAKIPHVICVSSGYLRRRMFVHHGYSLKKPEHFCDLTNGKDRAIEGLLPMK